MQQYAVNINQHHNAGNNMNVLNKGNKMQPIDAGNKM